MNNEEAIANLNQIYGLVSTDIQRSLDVAFKCMEERPQGEWIFRNGKYRCTACGEKAIYRYSGSLAITQTELLTQFCPNCGADMRKVIKND